MKIIEARKTDLNSFFIYLEEHLLENGENADFLFQPVSRNQKKLAESTKDKFTIAFSNEFGESGWRKLWVAKDESGKIRGHIDLRPHSDVNCQHRVLLGMGVDSLYRKQGIGTELIKTAINFCQENKVIDWLDLCVLSENTPARNLYLKNGFSIVGEFQDQYRIDGQSISETAMTMGV
ncbi:GNAT family N-acetyltransferase [Endozoicomonas gorgoniicola]|uniref:GNAT family N-acetyltransferase n=1 Tax=Endozoicomonas gorgoniicola TaxID=1234144 RepID=A0ABT3MQJ6_9GAMM|nr:GNAT family N-acetyltransferase [Endozoicomonas gorgoniicola]MCW7551627.1 GNAT family N-acetyltransferase [Endozoicomonas gorgoniicola]